MGGEGKTSPPKTRPKSAAPKLQRGKTMLRPKSAPMGRGTTQESSLNKPTSRVERRIWEVKQERANEKFEKEKAERKVRSCEERSDGLGIQQLRSK